MKFEVTENSNLRISLEDEADREWLESLLAEERSNNDILVLCELLEYTGWQPNGRLFQVNPEDIAALTDAPILSDDLRVADDGTVSVPGRVWWYPNYMLTHFGRQLLEQGSVLFHCAPPA